MVEILTAGLTGSDVYPRVLTISARWGVAFIIMPDDNISSNNAQTTLSLGQVLLSTLLPNPMCDL
eukprot:2544892-Pyramimonas_sp.AAC.1